MCGDHQAARMVKKVGSKIAAASGCDFQWEFHVIEADDVMNAAAMPGGKVRDKHRCSWL